MEAAQAVFQTHSNATLYGSATLSSSTAIYAGHVTFEGRCWSLALDAPRKFLASRMPRRLRILYLSSGFGRSPVRAGEKKRNAIFFHIPRSGGLSVTTALFGERVGHRTAVMVRAQDPLAFTESFKFCFVRNPWDRLVSAFLFLKQGGLIPDDALWAERYLEPFDDFGSFVRSLEDRTWRATIMSWRHFRPQHEFVCDSRKRILVDFVGRYERLAVDFSYVAGKLNVQEGLLPESNHSNRAAWPSYYDRATSDLVGWLYKDDIRIFGYGTDDT